jgi:8-oxo-dGTP pyrophosphatase MutT (NUDIX family)
MHRCVRDGRIWLVQGVPAHTCGDRNVERHERRRTSALDARGAAVATVAGTPMMASFDAITHALHPLDALPQEAGWNHDYLVELIGDAPRREAAVLMAIRDVREPRVVFTLRRDDLAHHAGQVSFPGGGVEPGDGGIIATALRESFEEIALDPANVEPLGFLDCLETISGFCVTPVVARMAADATLVPQPGEVARLFEVPLAFLLDPGNLREFEYRSHGVARKVYEYADMEPRIWGATAAMLVNLMNRMKLLP